MMGLFLRYLSVLVLTEGTSVVGVAHGACAFAHHCGPSAHPAHAARLISAASGTELATLQTHTGGQGLYGNC